MTRPNVLLIYSEHGRDSFLGCDGLTDSDFKYGKRGLIMKSTLTRLILVFSAMPSFILLASNQTPRNQRARGSFAGECDRR